MIGASIDRVRGHAPGGDETGFTLMELIVALGIFAMVVVSASDIFLIASQSQRRILASERAQSDARFAMEAMMREIRVGDIDYGYYAARELAGGAALGIPDNELAIVDSSNSRIRFYASGTPGDCVDAASTPCLMVAVDANAPVAITPRGVIVRNAQFYVSPMSDPHAFDPAAGTYASDEHPRVTIVLVLEGVAAKANEQPAVVSIQTTVATRVYRR